MTSHGGKSCDWLSDGPVMLFILFVQHVVQCEGLRWFYGVRILLKMSAMRAMSGSKIERMCTFILSVCWSDQHVGDVCDVGQHVNDRLCSVNGSIDLHVFDISQHAGSLLGILALGVQLDGPWIIVQNNTQTFRLFLP